MRENYFCHFCGRQGLKLWRPYADLLPLICAECAEKRQSPVYDEEQGTGKLITLPKWVIDEKGKIPYYHISMQDSSKNQLKTNHFALDVSDITNSDVSKHITFVPSSPCIDDTHDVCEFWELIPTKLPKN